MVTLEVTHVLPESPELGWEERLGGGERVVVIGLSQMGRSRLAVQTSS